MLSLVNQNGIAVFYGDQILLSDVQSALDRIGDAFYQVNSNRIVIFKENIADDFFTLSTGLLGEVLQKFVTYGVRLAIVGDFSAYKSRPLKAFITESNRGDHIFFAADVQAAIERLRQDRV